MIEKKQRYNRGKDGTNPLDKSFVPKPDGVVEELGGDDLQTLYVKWSPNFKLHSEKEFWEYLEALLAQCDEIMLSNGWDRKATKNGRDFPGDRTAEPFSELYYAGKIGLECWNFLTHHRTKTPNTVALAQAIQLGLLLTEYEWRQAFKPSIGTGRKQRRYLSESRGKTNAEKKSKVRARREAIAKILCDIKLSDRKPTGGALEKHLQKRLNSEHGISTSPRTIRRDLQEISKA